MKTLKNFRNIILLSLMVIAASCSKKSDNNKVEPVVEAAPPSIKIVGGVQDFAGVIGSPDNGEVNIVIEATTPAGFKNLNIYKVVDGAQSLLKSLKLEDVLLKTENTYTAEFSYLIEPEDVDREVYFEANAVDNENKITETIKLANLQAFGQMIFFEKTVGTALPAIDGGVDTPNFLTLGTGTSALDLAAIVTNDLSTIVDLAFSVNDGLGYYLSSPKACIETDLFIKFQDLKKTELKEVNITPDNFKNIQAYQTLEVEQMFNSADFYSHQQRAEQMAQNKCIAFKTDEGLYGLIFVKEFYTDNGNIPSKTYMDLNIWVCL